MCYCKSCRKSSRLARSVADPSSDPAIFVNDLQSRWQQKIFCLLLFEAIVQHFSMMKVIKKSQNSKNQGFSCSMKEGSGSVPHTNGSGSGRFQNIQHWSQVFSRAMSLMSNPLERGLQLVQHGCQHLASTSISWTGPPSTFGICFWRHQSSTTSGVNIWRRHFSIPESHSLISWQFKLLAAKLSILAFWWTLFSFFKMYILYAQ
jgi:hypothetical protein